MHTPASAATHMVVSPCLVGMWYPYMVGMWCPWTGVWTDVWSALHRSAHHNAPPRTRSLYIYAMQSIAATQPLLRAPLRPVTRRILLSERQNKRQSHLPRGGPAHCNVSYYVVRDQRGMHAAWPPPTTTCLSVAASQHEGATVLRSAEAVRLELIASVASLDRGLSAKVSP